MSPCSLVSCLSSASHFASLVWILLQTFHEGWGAEGKQSEIQWQLAPSLVFAQGHGQAVSPGTEGMLSWAARTEMTLGCLQHSLGVQMGVEKLKNWIKKAAQGFARNTQFQWWKTSRSWDWQDPTRSSIFPTVRVSPPIHHWCRRQFPS